MQHNKSLEYIKQQTSTIKQVFFIPGWLTKDTLQDDQIACLKRIYPQAEIQPWFWDSYRTWSIARTNAENEGKRIAGVLESTVKSLESTALVAHSLGGRVLTHALAAMGKRILVDHAVLLGAAIDYDHPYVDLLGAMDSAGNNIGGTLGPVLSCSNENDGVLKLVYGTREWKQALGLKGPKARHIGLENRCVPANWTIGIQGIRYQELVSEEILKGEMPTIDEIDQAVEAALLTEGGVKKYQDGGFFDYSTNPIGKYMGLDKHHSMLFLTFLSNVLS